MAADPLPTSLTGAATPRRVRGDDVILSMCNNCNSYCTIGCA
ncbi:MAG: hypothetical protein ACLR3C_15290 [Eggerthella lenta]